MEIVKYPDGTSYVSINYKQDCPNKTFKINSYEDLWQLNQFVDVCNHNDRIPIITIPCLIDAQADKRFAPDQSSGLKLVCKFLNNMNANFKIFHPHNAEVVEALIDNVEILNNVWFIIQVLSEIKKDKTIYPDIIKDVLTGGRDMWRDGRLDKNITLLFPDGGAYKWGAKLADKLNWEGDIIAAAKNRKFVDGKSILTQQLPVDDFEGRDILIIDDICIYGGTFKGLAKLLKERNCGKLYLAVSHLTIQNFEKEDNVFSYFDRVFTTNSKYDDYWVRKTGSSAVLVPNLEVIKMF